MVLRPAVARAAAVAVRVGLAVAKGDPHLAVVKGAKAENVLAVPSNPTSI